MSINSVTLWFVFGCQNTRFMNQVGDGMRQVTTPVLSIYSNRFKVMGRLLAKGTQYHGRAVHCLGRRSGEGLKVTCVVFLTDWAGVV